MKIQLPKPRLASVTADVAYVWLVLRSKTGSPTESIAY